MAITVISPFHRDLRRRLEEDLDGRIEDLAKGGAAVAGSEYDKVTVGERYAAKVAYISALRAVLRLCEEMDLESYSRQGRQD